MVRPLALTLAAAMPILAVSPARSDVSVLGGLGACR
jgi:hypothetical protein